MGKPRLVIKVFRNTGADKMIFVFLGFVVVCAFLIWLNEPEIETFREALWCCFTVISTIGFGDVVVHTMLSRGLTTILSIYAVVVMAIFTSVIVNYYSQMMSLRQKNSMAAVIDQLEHLPDLSREELMELSQRISRLNLNGHE